VLDIFQHYLHFLLIIHYFSYFLHFRHYQKIIRKELVELKSGVKIIDNFHKRSRKNIEEMLPNILKDIKYIVDSQSQTDPIFNTVKLYTIVTVKEVIKQLIIQKKYKENELPTLNSFLIYYVKYTMH